MKKKEPLLRMWKPSLRITDVRSVPDRPKEVDPIYNTPQHKAWREKVLWVCDNRCAGCGVSGEKVRLYADHIVELKDGGAPFDVDNGQALCGSCHTKKTITERAKRLKPSNANGRTP